MISRKKGLRSYLVLYLLFFFAAQNLHFLQIFMIFRSLAPQDAFHIPARHISPERPSGSYDWSGTVSCGDETAGCASFALATGGALLAGWNLEISWESKGTPPMPLPQEIRPY